jgi:hypothetical protein
MQMSKIAIIIVQMVKFIIGNDKWKFLPTYSTHTHTKNRPLTQFPKLSALSLSNAKEQQRISDGKSEEEGAKKKVALSNVPAVLIDATPILLSSVRLCGKVNPMPTGCPLHNANGTLFPSHEMYTHKSVAVAHASPGFPIHFAKIRSSNHGSNNLQSSQQKKNDANVMAKLELRVEFPPNSAPRVFAQPRPSDIVYTRISLILSNITTINLFPLLSHSN